MGEELSKREMRRLAELFAEYSALESTLADMGFESWVVWYRAQKAEGLSVTPAYESLGPGKDFPLAGLDYD